MASPKLVLIIHVLDNHHKNAHVKLNNDCLTSVLRIKKNLEDLFFQLLEISRDQKLLHGFDWKHREFTENTFVKKPVNAGVYQPN
jgi:hypothetical protein